MSDPTVSGGNVLPFHRPEEPLAYAPGTVPFDRSNPAHVRAWNTICALGWSERRRLEGGGE